MTEVEILVDEYSPCTGAMQRLGHLLGHKGAVCKDYLYLHNKILQFVREVRAWGNQLMTQSGCKAP